MPEILIFVGLQGAGKTTYFSRHFSTTHELISKDRMSGAGKQARSLARIASALEAGKSVVVDNTHPAVEDRAQLLELAARLGVAAIAYWFDTPPDECEARNARRDGDARVPDFVQRRTLGRLVEPTLAEGFDQVITVRNGKAELDAGVPPSGDVDEGPHHASRHEFEESLRTVAPGFIVFARIDGRGFASFTSGMRRPFDPRMTACMVETARHLVEETDAVIGYTQSDEVTLAWAAAEPPRQLLFNGRVAKLCSNLASMATVKFYREVVERFGMESGYPDRMPGFDCRVFGVPTEDDAVDVLLWREQDAIRNSVQMAAHHVFSDRELFQKSQLQMKDMLLAQGVNWSAYPTAFQRGTWLQRHRIIKSFNCDEIAKLPPRHDARANPALKFERRICLELVMPPFRTVINRGDVVFRGAAPIARGSETV